MTTTTVRTAKKLLLGHEIAHMMRAAGRKQAYVAELLQKKQGWVALLLSGGGAISLGDLEKLACALGFEDSDHLDDLRELRRDSHKRGYWTVGHNRAYVPEIRLQVDLERHADQIRSVELEAVPGLLQCESYIRGLHIDEPEVNGVTVNDMVQARLARQEVLEKDDAPLVHCVLSESCLRRVRGDRTVMREQMEHLIRMSDRPNVHLQVLPFDQPPGRRPGMTSPFVLVRVPSPGPAGPLELAYVEGPAEMRYLDARKALKAYEGAWTRLADAALTFDATRAFLHGVAEDYVGTGRR